MKKDPVTGRNSSDNYCYYYLHINGDLIHKSKLADVLDFEESDFVKVYWKIDLNNRSDAYDMLIRASMLGANQEKCDQLIKHWRITNEDTEEYIDNVGLIWEMDGTDFCVHSPNFNNLQEDTVGFGKTLFSAVCDFFDKEVNK